jgi:hypothetical protein
MGGGDGLEAAILGDPQGPLNHAEIGAAVQAHGSIRPFLLEDPGDGVLAVADLVQLRLEPPSVLNVPRVS